MPPTEPQCRVLELLLYESMPSWRLANRVPTSAQALTRVTSALRPYVLYENDAEVYYIPRESRDKAKLLVKARRA